MLRILESYKPSSTVLRFNLILRRLHTQIFRTLIRLDSVLDKEKKRPLLLNLANLVQELQAILHESLTLIKCVSGAGKVIPLLIILAAKNHLEDGINILKRRII